MKRPSEPDFDPSKPMISPCRGGDADRRIVRLVGVYDADGTVRGELAYWVGARLGRTHCTLCDITHGLARERSEWKTCRAGFPVPFDTYHRNDQPEGVAAASGGVVPIVLAETDDGFVVLLGPEELSECAGSVEQLTRAIESAVARTGLTWCADRLADVNILVLSIPDCPNARRMLELLQEATAGRHDVRIETSVVDPSQPMPQGFSGSPTVLIDGENRSGTPEISEPACASMLPSLTEVKDWIR